MENLDKGLRVITNQGDKLERIRSRHRERNEEKH